MMGADPTINDWNGCDSIMYAVKKNYYEIVCLLLDLSKFPINFDKPFFVIKTIKFFNKIIKEIEKFFLILY